jgi:hypothetical protein
MELVEQQMEFSSVVFIYPKTLFLFNQTIITIHSSLQKIKNKKARKL